MSYITLKDKTDFYYKDWGEGKPVIFSHGWPLSSDAFEDQMLFLAQNGYRVIAHDRRGHGRSSQPWQGHNMDQYADDLEQLLEHLKIENATHFGHSTGGGEVARYYKRHGSKGRIKKAGLIGAIPPIMIKTDWNPEGLDKKVFDDIREGVRSDRSSFFYKLADNFYGVKVNDGLRSEFWRLGMQGSIKALYDCIKVFSETDQRDDLKGMNIPVLVLYGKEDAIVPPVSSSEKAIKLLPQAIVKVVEDSAGHGLCSTHKDIVNEILLKFLKTDTV